MNDPATPQEYADVVDIFLGILNSLIPIIIGIALLIFIWGGVKFLYAGGSDDSVEPAKKMMFWGIIIIFIMVSMFGIIQIFYGDIIGGNAGIPVLPEKSKVQEGAPNIDNTTDDRGFQVPVAI